MSTIKRRTEQLKEVAEVTTNLKFNLDGYVYILSHEDFDKNFEPELLDQFQLTLDTLSRMNNLIMDAVNTMMMRLN